MKAISFISLLNIILMFSHALGTEDPPCCPPPEPPELCCGGETYNPTISNGISVDFSLAKFENKVKGKVNGTGCGWEPGSVDVGLSATTWDDCCDLGDGMEAVTQQVSVSGDIALDLGGFDCSYNFLSQTLPESIASLSATASVSFSVDVKDFSLTSTCEEPQPCATLSGISMTASGGAEFTAAAGYIKCCAAIEGVGSGSVDLCYDPQEETAWAADPQASFTVNAVLTVSSRDAELFNETIELWSTDSEES